MTTNGSTTATPDALQLMEEYYIASGRDADIDRMLHARERNGVLVESPRFVLMARPVCLSAAFDEIIDPSRMFDPVRCDAWYLHLVIGSLSLLPVLAPEYSWYPRYCYIRGARGDMRLRTGRVPRAIANINNTSNQ